MPPEGNHRMTSPAIHSAMPKNTNAISGFMSVAQNISILGG